MPDVLSEFHFLRPTWLVGLLALPFLIWLLHRLVARASAWREVLDNDLAEPLLVSRGQRSRLRPLPLLTIFCGGEWWENCFLGGGELDVLHLKLKIESWIERFSYIDRSLCPALLLHAYPDKLINIGSY